MSLLNYTYQVLKVLKFKSVIELLSVLGMYWHRHLGFLYHLHMLPLKNTVDILLFSYPSPDLFFIFFLYYIDNGNW